MATTDIESILRNHSGEFEPVVPFQKGDKIINIDFTTDNKELTEEIVSDEDGFVHFMFAKLESEKAKYAIGGYGENRTIYRRSNLFDGDANEARTVHLGVDIWGRPHTKVMAPWRGLVHSLGNNN